jgi:hypothetical protein
LTRKTKENNTNALKDWNSYLKNIYESPNVVDNIPNVSTKDKVFSIEDGLSDLQKEMLRTLKPIKMKY